MGEGKEGNRIVMELLYQYRREIAILCADKSEMQSVAEKMKTLNAMLSQK